METTPTLNQTSTATELGGITSRYRQAHERLALERDAVPEAEWVPITLDVPQVVSTVVGALPAIHALRPEIVRQMPQFELQQFDELESYALALGHAHTLYQAAIAPPESLQELGQQATVLRAQLLSDVDALVHRGLVNNQQLAKLKGPPGYLNLAFDLFLICATVRERLGEIANKTALTAQELDTAETLADRLVTEMGERQQGASLTAANSANRQRAFTQLVNVYDQARRAVSHLRWDHGDLETIAPSLYAGRARRKASDTDTESPLPVPVVGATPPLGNPSTPGTVAGNPPTDTQTPPGFPGGNPFIS